MKADFMPDGALGRARMPGSRTLIDPARGCRIGLRRAARHGGEMDQRIASAVQRLRPYRSLADVTDHGLRVLGNATTRAIDPRHRMTGTCEQAD